MSAQVPETYESTAILADKFCTGVQDAQAEGTAEIPTTRLNKTWHLSVIKHGTIERFSEVMGC